ncbi:MAG: 50S ribosomal protein L21 [Parcubacteria group bacterium]|nr:50S ribosomal protein L21 [Parcubacteria group bacterium]
MNAVIKTGGKQYLVKAGDTLKIEKIDGEAGANVTFDNVLLAFDDKAADVKIGTPTLSGASVTATIEEQGRGKKIPVIKYKPKTRYRRNVGHRQHFTKVKIGEIKA